jgi:outer membrane protein OmpA-like peptidoglycan-associated protein
MKLAKAFYQNCIVLSIILCSLGQSAMGQTRIKLPNPINTPTSIEYAPSITADGKSLIYQSDQYGVYVNAGKKVPKIDADGRSAELIDEFETSFFGVYEVKIHPNGEFMPPRNVESINQFANENMSPVMGGPSVSYDGNTLFFFANFGKNGYGREDIYFSTREKNGWGKPENIGSLINTDGYEGFPSVSPDGKRLYFTREVLGKKLEGKQVYRIMVSEKGRNGKWKTPFELPPPVNTGAEKAPRIMADSKTLIFSSIKEGGKGDFDLYKSTQQNDGTWTPPIPLDFINTKKSDLFVSMSPCGDIMYFVSNGDIYTAEVPMSLRPIKNAIVQGFVTDSLTGELLKAKIVIKDNSTNEVLAVLDNNPFDGRYTALLPFGANYDVSINIADYFTKTETISEVKLKSCEPIQLDLKITKLPTNQEAIVANASKNAAPIPQKIETPKATETSQNQGQTTPPTTKIEELELVADNPTQTSERISKQGEKINDSKLISQLALILAIVNKETGDFIQNPTFKINTEVDNTTTLKEQKNGNEYFFKVNPGDALNITINAVGFLPFSAKIPALSADKKVTIKMAPLAPSYINISLLDFESGQPLSGKIIIFSKTTKDSTRLNIVNGKQKYDLTKNDDLTITGRAEGYDDLAQDLKIEIPENGSKIYDLELKLASNKYILELEATDIESGRVIPNAVFHVFDSKGIKILDVLADENGKISKTLPKLDTYKVKCLVEGYKESEQQITDLKHNTKVLFKSVANKKRIHQLKVLIYDALTKEEIHPEIKLNSSPKGKAPFFAEGEENAIFDLVISGDGVAETNRKFAFNDSLINKVSTIIYVKRNQYDFYFKAQSSKTKDLVKAAQFKIFDNQTKKYIEKMSPEGQFTANLDTDHLYTITISAADYQPFETKVSPIQWVEDQEYERSFYIDPIIKKPVVDTPNIVKTTSFGDIEKGKSIALKNIYFDQSSPVLRSESFPELNQLIKVLEENPTIKILIKGHTDNAGDYKLNVQLSQERCESVIAYLVQNKIEKSRLTALGKGPDEPISPNTTEESRRKNRRVEFVVQ